MAVSTGMRPQVTESTARRPTVGASTAASPHVEVSIAPAGTVPRPWVQVPAVIGEGFMGFSAGGDYAATIAYPIQEAQMPYAATAVTEALGGFLSSTGEGVMPMGASVDILPVVTLTGEGEVKLEASSTSSGTLKFYSMGMDKSGSQTPSATLAKLVGFTARPGSSVTNDALVVVGAGTATVEGSVNFSNGASATHNARIYLNGSLLATGATISTTGIGTVSVASQQLVAGDMLELWAYSSLTSRTNVAAENTFLTVTPVA